MVAPGWVLLIAVIYSLCSGTDGSIKVIEGRNGEEIILGGNNGSIKVLDGPKGEVTELDGPKGSIKVLEGPNGKETVLVGPNGSIKVHNGPNATVTELDRPKEDTQERVRRAVNEKVVASHGPEASVIENLGSKAVTAELRSPAKADGDHTTEKPRNSTSPPGVLGNMITVPDNCPDGKKYVNGECREIW